MDEIKVTVVNYGRKNLLLRYIDPVTGKRKHKSAKATTMKEASKAAGKWEDELRNGVVQASNVTWAAFRQRYEDEVLASLATSTDLKVQGVFNAVEKHISPARLRDVTADRLSYLQSKLREAKLAESTIKGHLAHLMSALRWAVSIGWLPKPPKVTMPKRAKGANVMKGRPITGEEFDRLIAAVPKIVGEDAETVKSWQDYLRGLWSSGLRLQESLELSWDDESKLRVDLQPGELPMLRIPAALEKGNQDRLLPMAPEFAELLQSVPEAQRTGYVFNPKAARVHGERLGHYRVSKLIGFIGQKAGIKVKTDTSGAVKYASAHDLRRSFGLRWASRVMPQVLMELMRHESIDTTMRYYVGRNAQSTAAVLWEAHRLTKGNTFGNTAADGGQVSNKKTPQKQGVS
jgi:integrase